jgi:translation initiation factor IF-2
MKKTKETKQNNLQTRPPVVVILGHVDHGKTSILDYIRKSRVAEKESGGITQHIGAYQIEHQGKTITFLDTPGHEAFSAMRSRGVKVADIAVLVIAAEEGAKPQTKEAIKHIKKSGIPFIVALNKIDKKGAQPDKVKQELVKYEVNVESLGGDVPSVNVSAKTGQGIDELLEMINLVAEMEELKADFGKPASGVVIESRQDAKRGPTATILIKEGTLKVKDIVGTDSVIGKVKGMENFQGKALEKAVPSMPAMLIGFEEAPQVGEKFFVFENSQQAQARADKKTAKRKGEAAAQIVSSDKKMLNLILKADVRGSLEAIKEALKSIPDDEVAIRFLKSEIGDINESDIKLAETPNAKIVGFRVKIEPGLKQAAEQKKVRIATYEIIYELVQGVRESLSRLLEPEVVRTVVGRLKVLALFHAEKNRQIVGGKVSQGKVGKGSSVEIFRNEQNIGKGRLIQLQRNKKEADEIAKDQECGVLLDSPIRIEKGDSLEFYKEERIKREV